MLVNGRELTEIFGFLPDGALSVTRKNTDGTRLYQNSGANEYTNGFGGKFRFVTGARGIWISADGNTVFQLVKKQGLRPCFLGEATLSIAVYVTAELNVSPHSIRI